MNLILCLWLLGFVLALGTFIALSALVRKMRNVDVKPTSDTIVEKHEEDEYDGCIVDYDSSTLYPSSKMMVLSLDSIVPQYNITEVKNERLEDNEQKACKRKNNISV